MRTVPTPAEAPARETGGSAEVPLPPIESLEGLRSDYTAFFQQPVDEDLRRAALKKLFADPHFNQMDMLDVYVDDYTQFEPLPAALRMRLPSARAFLHGPEQAAVEAAEAAEAAAARADGGSESLAVATDTDREQEASPDVPAEASGQAANDSEVESTAALTARSAEVASTVPPARSLNAPSPNAIPPGKAAAPDPSST